MAVSATRVTVGTSPTRLDATAESDKVSGLDTPRGDGQGVIVSNLDASATVYLGGAEVSTGAGFALAAGASLTVDLRPGDALYGVVASGTAVCGVLQSGV
jgi:hypothetical protein